ncbi:hypothetical protein HPB52_024607 [Rhipicephalus sanguineus]|uniref:Uncharacterized protein n=1 Tax=Rhipicephalus sanguineus TaxID=34632 RepID=A0A9D4TE45_RHISA|nr:hypothetical protein HPB52_024607 [Rhipicephalus sanguineus]
MKLNVSFHPQRRVVTRPPKRGTVLSPLALHEVDCGAAHTNEIYFRKRLWKNRRTLRRVVKFRTPQPLLDKGVEIHDALQVAANEFVPEPFDLPEPHGRPNEMRQDSRNPDWHDHEAYIVHKKSRLLEGDKHMCLLTKTVRYDGLPTALSEHVRLHTLGEAQQAAAKEALAQVHLYDCTQVKLPKRIDLTQPHMSFPREFGVPVDRKVSQVLASYHHLCEKLTSQVPEAMDRTACLMWSAMSASKRQVCT